MYRGYVRGVELSGLGHRRRRSVLSASDTGDEAMMMRLQRLRE